MVYGVYCVKELDIIEPTRELAERHARSLVKHLNFDKADIKIRPFISENDVPERLR